MIGCLFWRPRKWRHFRNKNQREQYQSHVKGKITQAKFKQFMNFIFYKWGNYYFISNDIVVSNIGKDAWDSVSAITRVKPLRSSTLKLYSMLCRRRGASARERLKIASKGLWFVCTVMSPLPKSNWSNSLKAWTIVRVSFSINFMHISVLWARSRELNLWAIVCHSI